MKFTFNKAVNYSGYREGQSPLEEVFPSKKQIYEDLLLLENQFYYLRIYDCTPHAYRTLEVIQENGMDFKVMLGLSLSAEVNHINHPYFYVHKESVLEDNKKTNEKKIEEIIKLGNKYHKIVSSISVGNETRSIWNNNRVTIERLIEVANRVKVETEQPVTFCEEYQTWIKELEPLAEVVDFISLHTYPAWQGCPIDSALEKAVSDYNQVQMKYPDKYCIITETGWPTSSHGNKIKVTDATIENQNVYNMQLQDWGRNKDTLVYLFEAFDEPWKGEDNPLEPEKNWGIYYVDRTRK